MKKEIKQIITVGGEKICRVTTQDERWYGRDIQNEETGLPDINWLPSVTWIKGYYYTSPYLVKWIAAQGMTEAERVRKEAGIKGDRIHQATEVLDINGEVGITDKYLNKETGEMEELTADEMVGINSYKDYIDKFHPILLANEMTVFGENYAGTLDRIWNIPEDGKNQIWIIDLKTGKSIWKDMHLQVGAYSHAKIDYESMDITKEEWKNRKLAILQLGYARNKVKKYKFTEIPDRYDLFEMAYKVWAEENPKAKPGQKDFPLIIKSAWRKEQINASIGKVQGIENKSKKVGSKKTIKK